MGAALIARLGPRIAITGNSGSGKTFLAGQLGQRLGLPVTRLDELFWLPGSFKHKRDPVEVLARVERIAQGESWVVEGVFGELVQPCLGRASALLWLDMDWPTCRESLLGRGRQRGESEESFWKLVDWAARYDQRSDLRSRQGHQGLYEGFGGYKQRITSRDGIDELLAINS